MKLCSVNSRATNLHSLFLVFSVFLYDNTFSFIQEGVGDTPDSYAYDGHRVRKWNVATGKYGEVSINVSELFHHNLKKGGTIS